MAFPNMRALFLLPAFVVLLGINIAVLVATNRETSAKVSSLISEEKNSTPRASEGTASVLSANVIAGDAREPLIKEFLETKQSPLAPHSAEIVKAADKYKLDFRLIVAIAMCESNLGKRVPTKDSHNAWGISCYTGEEDKCVSYDDWPQAIERVSKLLREKYIDRGFTDMYEIGARWAPPSVEKGYSWTRCVEKFIGKIQ